MVIYYREGSMSEQLSVKHLLGIKDLTTSDIELIFATALNFKDVINRPIKKVPSLRDTTVANLFFENSTRTRLSFELAEKRLSADIINFSASSSSMRTSPTTKPPRVNRPSGTGPSSTRCCRRACTCHHRRSKPGSSAAHTTTRR